MPLSELVSRPRPKAALLAAAGSWRVTTLLAVTVLFLAAAPLVTSEALRFGLAKRFHVARELIWPDLSQEAVAGQLKNIVRIRVDHFIRRVSYRGPVASFYAERNFVPLWITKGRFNDRALATRDYMARAEQIGLDPDVYAVPELRASSAAALAEAELRLANAVLTYISDAQSGRLDYRHIAPAILLPQYSLDPRQALAAIANASDIESMLASFEPQHAEYGALKRELARLRADGAADPVEIDPGPPLSPGAQGERVAQIRKRLNVADEGEVPVYDQAVVDSVRAFQRERHLPATGLLDLATLDALNGPTDVDIIRANLERWRWLPHDLGKNRVVVNIPDFTMRVFADDSLQMATKVVVGAASHPTPIISDAITSLTVNPVWNVPASIAEVEYLPLLRSDPGFFLRNRFRIVSNPDGSTQFYQEPGEGNALGQVRFNFPNHFRVYQHDTPDKYLFNEERRDYSHGCIRVQNPLKYAEILLTMGRTSGEFTGKPLHTLFGPQDTDIPLYRPVPIYLTYQTAFVNDAGGLEMRDDIYGYDARIISALKSDERNAKETRLAWQKRKPAHAFAAGNGQH